MTEQPSDELERIREQKREELLDAQDLATLTKLIGSA
jgi:hypothetical protein